ncbi:type VII secretion-associated serine protease mycosin [Mycobacterium spongiae]|uniref:Type VII secretion-associated serine protease mycosin n=1 Tax=Mycobacterium spongiae TaxID=886343 RepID=A0A975JXK1_9MYCO|nr:type VII secretion-associated serine protease mycosin [Mycobacterium spongiae]QUR67566.1 type VII secretion-associated serine protease mycosin [Mycobacterium spongiae]
MQRFGTGSSRLWRGRTVRATIAAILLASGALAGLPPAYAISPPTIDPDALPPDDEPGPVAPMKQNSYCTEVGVLPGSDFRLKPRYMDMLNLNEAWQFARGDGVTVAVIDTGVTPHPRLPRLIAGGDYVMSGDGLQDCDAHGTIVASVIAAVPADGAVPLPSVPRRPVTIPTTEKPPPPKTVTVSPLPQTVTVVPGPPPEEGLPPGAPLPEPPPPPPPPFPAPPAPAGNHGGGTVTIPSYSGGGQVVAIDNPLNPGSPLPSAPPPLPDAFSGIAPGVEVIAIRQSSEAFGLKDPYTGDEDPQTQQKIDNIETMARAIVHAANMGASVINISDVMCMSARNVIDQRALGAAVHYAAVDKNVVIVAAAGDSSKKDCKQNPIFDPLEPDDPRDWNAVTTVVTPSWFHDYVLTVGAVDSNGQPMTKMTIPGPWVSISAPGTDVVGLSPRDDGLINAIDGPDNQLLVPAGTSFSAAIVSGVAALVRSKFPDLTAFQVINRLIHTARPPARGVDNQVGYGVVDPVAALTWDVPRGPAEPPKQLSAPLVLPEPPAERNMVPVWVAAGGLTGALLIGGAVFGTATLMRRSRKQR